MIRSTGRPLITATLFLLGGSIPLPAIGDGPRTVTTPRLFAEGAVSTPMTEQGIALSRDGQRAIFAVGVRFAGTGKHFFLLAESRRLGGAPGEVWSEPRTLPFSGRYADTMPCFDSREHHLYFLSNRPLTSEPADRFAATRLWRVAVRGGGNARTWGRPEAVAGTGIESLAGLRACSLSAEDVLWCAARGHGGSTDLFRLEPDEGGYPRAETLPAPVQSEDEETDPLYLTDRDLLVFAARRDGRRDFDLFASRLVDGRWSPPRRLGPGLNSKAHESAPAASPDGERLYFTTTDGFDPGSIDAYDTLLAGLRSVRNGQGNIVWVPLAAIEESVP